MSLGGSSSSGSTTVVSSQSPTDPEAARRMAAVAERQQDIAEEQWSLYQGEFLPYDKALAQANLQSVQPTADLTLASIRAETGLLPQRTAATGAFLDQALKGVDVNSRVARAGADVAQAYGKLPDQLKRSAAAAGISPGSQAFLSQLTGLGLSQARDTAFAKSQAKTQAEAENFSRLSAAQGINWTGADANQGDYGLTSPAQTALGYFQNAVNANAAGMRPLSQSNSQGSSKSFGFSFGG